MTAPAFTDPILDEAALERLSGCKQAAAQIRWLEENHIPYTLSRLGRPRTTLALYEQALTRDQHGNGYKSPKAKAAA